MEALFELVDACFARHGIECPAGDSKFVQRRTSSPVSIGTVALGCPSERSLAVAGGQSNSECSLSKTTPAPEAPALPEHNFRKSSQAFCP